MWFSGNAVVQRGKRYDVRRIGKRVSWKSPVASYGPALQVDPWTFAYAATRASVVETTVSPCGRLAGAALSTAALVYLTARSSPRGGLDSLNLSSDFALLKDFVGTSLKGTIGAAIAYIEMQNLGYAWAGHWEECVASPPVGAHPDFVFATTEDVCLLDAKGSATDLSSVERLAKSEWSRQILPNASASLAFGGHPTEGRIVASSMSYGTDVQLVAAHGKFKSSTSPAATSPTLVNQPAASESVRSIQIANFVEVCDLLGQLELSHQLRNLKREIAAAGTFLYINGGTATIDSGDRVILSNLPSTIINIDGSAWSMRLFCRHQVLNAALRVIASIDSDGAIPKTTRIVAADSLSTAEGPRIKSRSPLSVIVQGLDGVGALFLRVNESEQ